MKPNEVIKNSNKGSKMKSFVMVDKGEEMVMRKLEEELSHIHKQLTGEILRLKQVVNAHVEQNKKKDKYILQLEKELKKKTSN